MTHIDGSFPQHTSMHILDCTCEAGLCILESTEQKLCSAHNGVWNSQPQPGWNRQAEGHGVVNKHQLQIAFWLKVVNIPNNIWN